MGRTRRRRAVGRDGGAGGRRCMLRPVARGARGWCMKGFRDFILRGNVVELAVAVVIGAAFGAVVTAFVKDLLTPLIAAVGGEPDFAALDFTVNGSRFAYGDFINTVVAFVIIAAAV